MFTLKFVLISAAFFALTQAVPLELSNKNARNANKSARGSDTGSSTDAGSQMIQPFQIAVKEGCKMMPEGMCQTATNMVNKMEEQTKSVQTFVQDMMGSNGNPVMGMAKDVMDKMTKGEVPTMPKMPMPKIPNMADMVKTVMGDKSN